MAECFTPNPLSIKVKNKSNFRVQGRIPPDGEAVWSPDKTTTSWVNMASVTGCENYMYRL